MVMLPDYTEFAGTHTETGTIRNALAYQGVKTPHNDAPISEALLLGISGGITVGYFKFEYAGYPPHIALLTRNTFDPLETLFDRLAIPREVLQSGKADKGEANLREALEGGKPAIVWADMFSLPYNNLQYDENNWGMRPLLVYGLEDGNAYVADRAQAPFIIPEETLTTARGRVAKDKYRVMTLDAPDFSQLSAAVSKGIWQCINLFTEAPPKGKRDNFGLAALQHLAKMLTNTRNKDSWARYFPPGERLWMALAGDTVQEGMYGGINRGAGNFAERGMYADFLLEASVILDKPDLNEAANTFRHSEQAWQKLAAMLLPDDVALLAEARHLLDRKHTLFKEQGGTATDEIAEINTQFKQLQQQANENFPMDDAAYATLREGLAEQVLAIHDIEKDAVACMQSIMA